MALSIAQRLDEKQAVDIVILDVSGPLVIADYFIIATVQSTRQGQALAKELDFESKAVRGRRRRNTGGMETEESNWVLLDFDDIVVHLFLPEARAYYALETLWADVPRLPFTPSKPVAAQRTEVRQPTLDGFGAFQPQDPPREHG
ncbi:MAG: ribosome silencing factor [Planctomycetota bacterium]